MKEQITPLQRQAAQEYLTNLGLVGNVQTILNDLCRARPDDPYAFVLNRLADSCIPATIHSLEAKVVFGTDMKPVTAVGMNCMHQARITATGVSRVSTDDDGSDEAEGGAADGEEQKSASQVLAEIVATTFSGLLEGINPSDQAAVDAALLAGAKAEGKANDAAAAAEADGGCAPPEASPAVLQQIKVENAAVLASSLAALQASAFVTGTKAFVRAETLRSEEAGPASVPQLAFPIFNCSDTGGKLKMRGAWITAPAGADRGESLGPGFGTDDAEAAAILTKVYLKIQEILCKKTPVAPDSNGGFPLKADKPESLLDLVDEAIKAVGAETGQVQVILDAGIPYNADKQKFEMVAGGLKSAEEQVALYADLVTKRPVLAGILDPFPLEFPEAWAGLKAAVGEGCIIAGGRSCCNSVAKLTPAPKDKSSEGEDGNTKASAAEGGDGGGGDAAAAAAAAAEEEEVPPQPMGGAVTLSLTDLKTLSGVGAEASAAQNAGMKILLDASASTCPQDPTVMDFAAGLRADIVCIGGPLVAGGEMLNRLVDIADQIVRNLGDVDLGI